MIRGNVNQEIKPVVPIRLLGPDGREHPFSAVMDTGFNGDLILPLSVIHRLGLARELTVKATLADGQEVYMDGWKATALWHDQQLDIIVLESTSETLLGMGLLLGSKVTMEVTAGGAVIIEEQG